MGNGTEDQNFTDRIMYISYSTLTDISAQKLFQTQESVSEGKLPKESLSKIITDQARVKGRLQNQKIRDLAEDMSRKTGDFTLYGKNPFTINATKILIG
jgi:hypothetical protein